MCHLRPPSPRENITTGGGAFKPCTSGRVARIWRSDRDLSPTSRTVSSRYPVPLSPRTLDALLPCSHGAGCPLGVDVPGLAEAVRLGERERAWRIARGPNPFASTCGHGCHAPCETGCRRRYFGAPVAIGALESHAASAATPGVVTEPDPCITLHDARSVAASVARLPVVAASSARSVHRIAVLGAGAAGMACVHDLALLGHRPVLFEADAEPGGLLTGAVPDFRFPVAAARAECAAILAMEIDFRPGVRIEGVAGVRALLSQGFEAVFVAAGASDPAHMLVECPPRAPSSDALAFLRAPIPHDGPVVVIGDGDLAVDAARVAARHPADGAAAASPGVDLVLECPLDESAVRPEALAAALRDGVRLHGEWQPRRVLDGGPYPEMFRIELERDAGRDTLLLPFRHLVVASPRVPAPWFGSEGLAVTHLGRIAADAVTLQTSIPRVWAGGACAFGHRSIAHAVADGKRAAWSIHAALTGRTMQASLFSTWVEDDSREMDRAARALGLSRIELPLLGAPPADPFSPPTARAIADRTAEAARCFDCRVLPAISPDCTGCGECVHICPVDALALSDDGENRLVVDQDRCTRCGLCAERCPEDAIVMARAVWEERLSFGPAGTQ